MPFGQPPFVRDFIDAIIERRLRAAAGQTGPPDTVLRNPFPNQTAYAPPPPKTPAFNPLDESGQAAIAAGLQAGLGQPNFGRGLLAGLGSGLSASSKGRAAAKAEAQDLEDKQFEKDIKLRTTKADEIRADAAKTTSEREPSGHRTKYEDITGTVQALRDQGWSQDRIDKFLEKGGAGGAGGGRGWKPTDRESLAQSLLATGRVETIEDGRIAAAVMLKSAQPVGSISKVSIDPETFNSTTTRLTVFRRTSPLTLQPELVDEMGNILTEQDMKSFRQGNFTQGTGGPESTPQPPLDDASAADLGDEVVGGGADVTDFTPGIGSSLTEEQIIQALSDPRTKPEVLRLYGAGRGPMGNSTKIKAFVAQRLQGMPGSHIGVVPSH